MSARFEIIRVRTLANGTTITDHDAAMVARDSKGRVFWQRVLPTTGAGPIGPIGLVSVSDPVSGESFQLQTQRKTASIVFNAPIPAEKVVACHNAESRELRSKQSGAEQLGTKVIEGLTVEGVRTVSTVPIGATGNSAPMVSTEEHWFSEELNLNVQGRREDPRSGVSKFEYTDIQRGEPDASIFRIPDGFTVTSREQIQVAH